MVWKPHVTVAAVVLRDGKFLLVEEETESGLAFNQPAGHLEEGESLVDAVVRETLEADVCEDLDPELPLRDSAWVLPDDLTLVQLSCFAGAYNFGSRWYWLAPGAQPHSVPFPAPDEDGAMTVTGELVNASFDPATGLDRKSVV